MMKNIGNEILDLVKKLWPYNRSITGDGVRQTLKDVKEYLPELKIFEVPSGTKAFDWVIPDEWRITDAWIKKPNGEKICEFKKNNIHLVGYSTPQSKKIDLEELQKNLYSLPEYPDAIPYITSYYDRKWGFCLSHNQRKKLKNGMYEIFIDSKLFKGSLTYGELIIKGRSKKEIFLSTYVCHPSMANNELSGPAVTTFLAQWIKKKKRNFTYRIIFIPETIGSILYLSKNLLKLKKNVFAGFNISCVGDNRSYSFLPSRLGNTYSDSIARHVLKNIDPNFTEYKWSDRGSDERQYCSPLVDLPICSIMRTKYGTYREYHTSMDNLDNVVNSKGLEGGYKALLESLNLIEENFNPIVTQFCEPQLSRRGLYPSLSEINKSDKTKLIMNILTWADGNHSILDIAEICEKPFNEVLELVKILRQYKLIKAL